MLGASAACYKAETVIGGFHSCVTARLCSCLFDLQGIIQQSVGLWSDSAAYVVPSLPFQASKTQNPVSTSVPGLQSAAIMGA